MNFSLNGTWELFYGPQDEKVKTLEEARSKLDRIEVSVPGEALLDLYRLGKIDDPFFADNFLSLRPYEFYQWWYVKEFDLDAPLKEKIQLIFRGIIGVGEVWLNGELLGSCENSFIEHAYDVTNRVKSHNLLVVKLTSPLDYAANKSYDTLTLSWEGREEALWLRMPQHSFGWDIAPRILSVGITKGVELVSAKPGIEELHYSTKQVSESEAAIDVFFKLSPSLLSKEPLTLRFSLCPLSRGDKKLCQNTEFTVEFVAGHLNLKLTSPLLWWPKGYGEPNLYNAKCELVQAGKIIDVREDRIGVRTVHLERDAKKGLFRFVINGIPLRLRGANWTPLDAFHSRDSQRLQKVLALYNDLGCNIIRCWGGGVYEDDEFFDFCDEHGIAVWQDFAMACARYPQTEGFKKALEEEVTHVVKRLRNHPSLILWAGDNECDIAYREENLSPSDNSLTRQVVPALLKRLDPNRPYIPSSPYISDNLPIDSLPEQHLWGPRDYFKGPFYTQNKASFISEIGYHGCPNRETLESFLPAPALWPPDDYYWRLHSVEHWLGRRRDYSRIELMINQEREYFGEVPEDLDDFIKASQITQAEALKFFIERARLSDQIWGIIWWNVIDPWPQVSDSVVDYNFRKKLAYNYVKRAQRPFIIAIAEPMAWKMNVVAINDTRNPVSGSYEVKDADGNALANGEFEVQPMSRKVLASIPAKSSEKRLLLISWEIGGNRFTNHYVAGMPPFDLEQYNAWLSLIRPNDARYRTVSLVVTSLANQPFMRICRKPLPEEL